MLIKGKTNSRKILILLIIVVIISGGILEYYHWRGLEQVIVITNNKKEMSVSAGVVPHHLLAEKIIEDFFSYIASKDKPETIILLSPDHFKTGNIVGNSFITIQPDTQEFYHLKIDAPLIKNLSLKHKLIFSNSSINFDHGITDLIPFIKKYFPDSKTAPFIIPFNISREETEQFTNSLNSLAPPKAVVIASVDFSHYLPPSIAQFHDVKSIRTLINFQKTDFENLEVDSWQALYIARAFANLRKKELPKVIGYANSTDFLTNKDRENKDTEETTSYFSVVFEEGDLKKIKEIEEFNGKTILFVGDIMLNRRVEYLMNKNSFFYPFEKVNQFLRGIDIVVGNLEGPIVKNPPNFSDKSLKFAFSPEVVKGLLFANFNLLSLANNHTFDMGEAGFKETKEFLAKANINFLGHPLKCNKDFLFEKDNIIFLAFNKTFSNCLDKEIVKIVKETKDSNLEKFLIVIFHWGEEYQLKSLVSQQKLARQIIDAGADLIIGSHPHVIQEVEEYQGRLIFYSLGNFIFDQYFSKETQEGLAVGVEIYPKKVVYKIFPIKSKLSQPFLMEPKEAKKFLENLAQKSDLQLSDGIKMGIIEIERLK